MSFDYECLNLDAIITNKRCHCEANEKMKFLVDTMLEKIIKGQIKRIEYNGVVFDRRKLDQQCTPVT